MNSYAEKVGVLIERYRFKEAQNEMMNLARLGNKYLADNEPWKLVKTDEERVKVIMKLALEISAKLSIISSPFLLVLYTITLLPENNGRKIDVKVRSNEIEVKKGRSIDLFLM